MQFWQKAKCEFQNSPIHYAAICRNVVDGDSLNTCLLGDSKPPQLRKAELSCDIGDILDCRVGSAESVPREMEPAQQEVLFWADAKLLLTANRQCPNRLADGRAAWEGYHLVLAGFNTPPQDGGFRLRNKGNASASG